MFKYVFTGKILPEQAPFRNLEFNTDIKNPLLDLEFHLRLIINKSNFNADITSQKEITDTQLLRIILLEVLSLLVNIEGYIQGCYYDIDIMTVYDENKKTQYYFKTTSDELQNDSSVRPIKNLDEILDWFSNPKYNYLRTALNDLGLSIKYPTDHTFYSFRKIEGLRKFFDENSSARGWQLFADNLNISTATKDLIKGFANEPPHGGFVTATKSDLTTNAQIIRKIIDRFIMFALNNCKPLDKSTYPQL